RYKLASFVLAGTLAGLSGYLAAAQFGYVNPELLGWRNSGDALMMVILGGMGTLFGPVLGAFALVLLQEVFADLTKHWLLLMGGSIRYAAAEIAGLASDRIARLGVARSYQKTNIFAGFTAFENCRLAAQSRLPSSMRFFAPALRRADLAAAAERALTIVGLD